MRGSSRARPLIVSAVLVLIAAVPFLARQLVPAIQPGAVSGSASTPPVVASGSAGAPALTQLTRDLEPFREGELWGYRTRDGRVVIKPRFVLAKPFWRDRAVVWLATDRGVRATYIDPSGRTIAEPRLTVADDFDASGLAHAWVDAQWGYINERGKWVIEPQFQAARPFSEGRAAVAWYAYPEELHEEVPYAWTHIDAQGNWAMAQIMGAVWAGDYSHGVAPYRCANGSYGTVGALQHQCQWAGVCPYDGHALLAFSRDPHGLDEDKGCVAGEPLFLAQGPLAAGYARVAPMEFEAGRLAIGRIVPGEPVRALSKQFNSYEWYPNAEFSSSPSVLIAEDDNLGTAVFAADGQVLVNWLPQRIVAYNAGILIYVTADPADPRAETTWPQAHICRRLYGALFASGKELLSPRYAFLDVFSEGLAAACEAEPTLGNEADGNCRTRFAWCGYLNRRGEHVIDAPRASYDPSEAPEGSTLESARDQRAYQMLLDRVRPRWTEADARGQLLGVFKNGRATMVGVATDGTLKVGLIDRTGRWLVEPKFDIIGEFRDVPGVGMLAPAQVREEQVYLDRAGRRVQSPL